MSIWDFIWFRIKTKKIHSGELWTNFNSVAGKKAYIIKNGKIISGEIGRDCRLTDTDYLCFIDDSGCRHDSDIIYLKR